MKPDFSEFYLPAHMNGVFSQPSRVYNHDIDAGRVVFVANFLKFMERTRTEWLRYIGVDLKSMERDQRMGFVVQEMNVKFIKPAYLDDLLAVTVEVEDLGRSSIKLIQTISRGGELLCTASIATVCINVIKFRPVAMPKDVRSRFQDELDARVANMKKKDLAAA